MAVLGSDKTGYGRFVACVIGDIIWQKAFTQFMSAHTTILFDDAGPVPNMQLVIQTLISMGLGAFRRRNALCKSKRQ